MSNSSIIDSVVSMTGMSRPNGAMTDMFAGFDHRNAGTAFPRNTDHQGLVFFSRPRINLTYDNILTNRIFTPLLAESPKSPYRAIRCMLDPVIGAELKSDIFDVKQAFMPLLTNTCLTISGFPDLTLNTYTSTEGIRKESFSMVDDVGEINGVFDITANFANAYGDPITKLFHAWTLYSGYVYSGDMVPYPEQIIEREIDYHTRIWRLVLDERKKFVTKIGSVVAAFPMANPLGAFFNYSREDHFIKENDQISIPFRCMGVEYEDPILLHEFNLTVQMFNGQMRDGQRETSYRKLSDVELVYNNFKGYPRIDLLTRELEWWVPKNDDEAI